MDERETIDVDVVIVGAGPAGLSAAIRLGQLANAQQQDISILIVEKADAIGAHTLSGAVLDPAALDFLIPDWKAKDAPIRTPVKSESFTFLTASDNWRLPNALLPPPMKNRGNYIVSLGEVCRWLAGEAEAMGIDIIPGFSGESVLYGSDGEVVGIRTGDKGRDKQGRKKATFAPGIDIRARYTLLAEGARGSLSLALSDRFDLCSECEPQKYGLGIKEIWEIDPGQHRSGHIQHTLGWPLSDDTGGGGFIYHGADNTLTIGLVVHLNYTNPHLSPFDEMQRFKTHPHIRPLLENGRRIAYGARTMTSGGWQSIPRLAFPGGALIGCAAGFMNLPRIKGIHNAMWSGIKTAEHMFPALRAGRGNDLLSELDRFVRQGQISRDLEPVRNVKPLLARCGTLAASLLGGMDMWANTLFKISALGTLKHGKPDCATLKLAKDCDKITYPTPDGKLTFDRLSSVYLTNTAHDEDQPVHLRLANPDVPIQHNLPLYDEPAQRYCPAGVYEVVLEDDNPSFRINAANCIHCKACDIKDPLQNLRWVPPEGGSGPKYKAM